MMYGSAPFADHVPTRMAEAVRLLEAAGHGNEGKTNLHESAYGVTSEKLNIGMVPNPLRQGRIAADRVLQWPPPRQGWPMRHRNRLRWLDPHPAACCGIVGQKPMYGLVSLDGCFPLAPSWDHVGPMARTVRDCVAMMEALAPASARLRSRSRT